MTDTDGFARSRRQGGYLRDRLIAAAGDLLGTTQTVALPSLRAVARACSVSPAAVYLQFASGEELLLAVIDAQLADLGRFITSAARDIHDPLRTLSASALAYATWGLDHPGAYQLLFESADRLGIPDLHGPLPADGAAHRGDQWDLLRAVAEQLGQARSTHSTKEVTPHALRLWAGLHGIVSLRLHKPELAWPGPLESETRLVVERVLAGLTEE